MAQPIIAVCGAGVCGEGLASLAFEVGRLVAESGAMLICGGLGGVMAAACRGARSVGGITVGILPGTSVVEANPDVLIPIASGMGQGRNLLIVQTASAIIAIGGEYGTLSEIALARKLGRPVIGLLSWQLGVDLQGRPHMIDVDTPAQAVATALGKPYS